MMSCVNSEVVEEKLKCDYIGADWNDLFVESVLAGESVDTDIATYQISKQEIADAKARGVIIKDEIVSLGSEADQKIHSVIDKLNQTILEQKLSFVDEYVVGSHNLVCLYQFGFRDDKGVFQYWSENNVTNEAREYAERNAFQLNIGFGEREDEKRYSQFKSDIFWRQDLMTIVSLFGNCAGISLHDSFSVKKVAIIVRMFKKTWYEINGQGVVSLQSVVDTPFSMNPSSSKKFRTLSAVKVWNIIHSCLICLGFSDLNMSSDGTGQMFATVERESSFSTAQIKMPYTSGRVIVFAKEHTSEEIDISKYGQYYYLQHMVSAEAEHPHVNVFPSTMSVSCDAPAGAEGPWTNPVLIMLADEALSKTSLLARMMKGGKVFVRNYLDRTFTYGGTIPFKSDEDMWIGVLIRYIDALADHPHFSSRIMDFMMNICLYKGMFIRFRIWVVLIMIITMYSFDICNLDVPPLTSQSCMFLSRLFINKEIAKYYRWFVRVKGNRVLPMI